MQTILHRHGLAQRAYVLDVVRGAALFVSGLLASAAARAYLGHADIHPVSSPDLFLDILPTFRMENLLVWGVPVLIAFTSYVLLLHPQHIPSVLKGLGLLFLARSFFVILTPMGVRPDQVTATTDGFFHRLAYTSNDFFFSGHVAAPFMLALIFRGERWVRNVMFGISAIFAFGVLITHTHYSIDVFAVPFLVPTIERFARRGAPPEEIPV